MPSYDSYLKQMDRAGPYCTDPVGMCLRQAHAVNGVPNKTSQRCIRDSETYAAAMRREKLWERFDASRAVPGWLRWTHKFSSQTPATPEAVLVDWSSGVFRQKSLSNFGCVIDVAACLWTRTEAGQWEKMVGAGTDRITTNGRSAWDDLNDSQHSYLAEPETTKMALVDARLGQGKFRDQLLLVWAGKCAVTKCAQKAVLRASHIKPWRDSSNVERLDRYNGLLLSPNLDAAFDCGLVSFADSGEILFNPGFSEKDRGPLGLLPGLKLVCVFEQNRPYLAIHRKMHGFAP